MSQSIKVIYGSTTGNTQRAGGGDRRRTRAGTAVSAADAVPDDFKADLLILGSSTWGCGELQDDWQSALPMLEAADLSGRKVALFGLGDAGRLRRYLPERDGRNRRYSRGRPAAS